MARLTPYRLAPDAAEIPAILALLHEAFDYMEGRIDPPSSLHRLSLADIATQAETGEVWAIGTPPVACMFLTPAPDHLYLGKLAVAASHRQKGLARRLVGVAIKRARARHLPRLVLKTRIELTENQRAFAAMGFRLVAHETHPGHARPTSCRLERDVT